MSINPAHLQRVVMEAEFGKSLDFDALCQKVASGMWAKNQKLDAQAVGRLICEHGTITKCQKPELKPEPSKVVQVPEPLSKPEMASVVVKAATTQPMRPKAPAPAPAPKAPAPATDNGGKVYDEGGKGRKQCPSCKKYVPGVRKQCVCGHTFVPKTKGPEVPPEPKEPREPRATEPRGEPREPSYSDPRLLRVSTPAGACPHKLKSMEWDDVQEWAELVRAAGRETGRFYTVSALIYFVRHTYDINSPEYQTVKGVLLEMYGHERAA